MSIETFNERKNIEGIGLVNGQMGLCINLYEFGKNMHDESITTLADDLMDEIYTSIEKEKTLTWQFASGLTGLGWGIEYLVQQGFIEADTNEVLRDVDDRAIVQRKYGTNMKIDLYNGFLGLGYYFLKRLKNPDSTDDHLYTLLMKQHTIGVIEHLDAFRHSVQGFAKRAFELGHYMVLPTLAYYLQSVYKMNIFNTRVSHLIAWFLENIRSVVPGNESFKLSLMLSFHFVNGLTEDKDDERFVEMLNTVNRESLLSEISSSSSVSILNVVKAYHIMARSYKDTSVTNNFIFWCKKAIEELDRNLESEDHRPDISEKLGLLDGFYGFHKLLVALSLYSKLEVQTVP